MKKKETHETPASESSSKTLVRFPLGLVAVSTLAVVVLGLLFWQFEFLNDRFNLNPGIPYVLLIVISILGVLVWSSWFFFMAKSRWLGFLIFVIPTGFLLFYHPDFGGDANITGWKPRFWQTERSLSGVITKEDLVQVDLLTTTPFDFPQFMGLDRDGRVEGIQLSDDWEQSKPKLIWKQPVGEGWSGFAAVNGFAITQEQRDELECVTCYRIADGQLMWIYTAQRRHEDRPGFGRVGPRATPTIDNGLVYTMGGTGVLDCLDGSNGELVWSADIPQLVGITLSQTVNSRGLSFTEENSTLVWGRSGSPLIFKDMVIVSAGRPASGDSSLAATMIAFDKKTGQEIWRGGERMISYGSPSVGIFFGEPQILLMAEDHAVGHDPETGVEIWSHLRPGNSGRDANCSQVTQISENQLLFSKGYNLGGEVIELIDDRGSDKIEVKSIAQDRRVLKTKLTNPVIKDNFAYSLSDGFLECTELPGLQRRWKQRGRFGNGQLLLVEDKLLIHTEDGELVLAQADHNQYIQLGTIKTISGTCWNTICLFGNRVLVRSDFEMACFELPLEATSQSAQFVHELKHLVSQNCEFPK